MSEVRISDIIAEPFGSVHRAIKAHEYTHYWLKGGRGSTKSSFAAIEIVLGIMRNPQVNAVIIRKVANTMRDSVYADIFKAIDRLGVARYFHGSVSPMEIVYKPTGQRILFRGADDPAKLKSVTVRHGYVGLVWVEELDQLYGMAEVRNILQSLLRGGDNYTVLYSYNPPKSRDNWTSRECLTHRADRLIHESTYLDVPRHWLGETFFSEAQELLRTEGKTPEQVARDLQSYNHEYLGEVTGTGGAVFENVELREITDAEVAEFDRLYNGVDFGWFPDPVVFGRHHYDAKTRTLYTFGEFSSVRVKNDVLATRIKEALTYAINTEQEDAPLVYHRELVLCDSADPQNIADLRDCDIDARGVKKGPGSVEYGVKWLQGLAAHVIDPTRAPLHAREFTEYEYMKTRDGEYCSTLPDKDNHGIDETRYAVQPLIRDRSEHA